MMEMPKQDPFQVGECIVDPATGDVSGPKGTTRLEPKAVDVLVYLADNAGRVVSRMELEDSIWAGVIVGPNALTGMINKIRRAFDDDSKHPKYIETLSKKGYRIVAPITKLDANTAVETASKARVNASDQKVFAIPQFRKKIRIASALTMVITVVAVWWLFSYQSNPLHTVPFSEDTPSVAVLPFVNISGDPGQEYFADGITEDIITDLSKVSRLFVISRTSIIGYKGKDIHPIEASKELGARYILSGSVQRAGNRLRIAVHLDDTKNGAQIWGERYDRNLDDVFSVQDEITKKIVTAMVIHLTSEEEALIEHRYTTDLQAHDYYMRGRRLYLSITKEQNNLARKMFHEAIRIDPKFARAYGALALTYVDDYRRKWNATPQQSVDQAIEMANKAVSIDQKEAVAHWALGYVNLYGRKDPKASIASTEKSIRLHPNYADGYALLASANSFEGHSKYAIRLNKLAMKLNPKATFIYHANLGRDYYFTGRIDDATEHLKQAIRLNFNYLNAHVYLAAVYASTGQNDDAAWEAEQLVAVDPEFSLAYWLGTQPYSIPERLQKLSSDLKRAGLPK